MASDAPPPVLVLLAAGASRRLGAPKALVPLGGAAGDTPLERLLHAGRGLEAELPPLLVTGADHEALARAAGELGPGRVELLFHARWEGGRTGGVALAAERRSGRDLCVAPVDVPLVSRSTFAALAARWREAGAPARGWLAPFVHEPDGRRRFGHPVVVGRALAAETEALSGSDPPLRALRDRAEPLLALEVADRAVLDDLDTPADLERLRAREMPPG